MKGNANGNVIVKVFRFDPSVDPGPRYETYEVPFTVGMRVLDVLDYIRSEFDRDFAYRSNCRSGQCGSCAVMINGRPGLACQTSLGDNERTLTIEPLPVFPIIRDLVVDLEKGYAKLMRLNPFMHRAEGGADPSSEKIYPKDVEEISPLRGCIECWSCVAACPVISVDWSSYFGPLAGVQLARLCLNKRNAFDHLTLAFLEGLSACTQCGNCADVCPREIDIPEKAIGKMRYLAYNKRGLIRRGHANLIESLKREYNPLGESRTSRADWAKDLGIEVPRIGDGGGASILYFVGCMASWRERTVARATAALLSASGADYAILGSEERDCGSILFRLGDLDLALEFAKYMKKVSDENGFSSIITSCAGCFRTFKKDYPEKLGIELGPSILHSSQYFKECIRNGSLKIINKFGGKAVTYHDPCHLGRHVGVYEDPREIIKSVGLNLVEMSNNRHHENSRCCGAGGGVRSGHRELAKAIADYRIKSDVPHAVNVVVHACPFCYFNFEDARSFDPSNDINNVDITEILLLATSGEGVCKKVLGSERFDFLKRLLS
jgi:fumarate reductase (CoM/CoB) subunit B